jgi:TRAP-type C4-dicarboxylate transport system permease small subunit
VTGALAAVVRAVAAGAALLVRALTLAMLAVLSYQVFMRSVLSKPPSWTEEAALLAFSWAVLLGIAVGVREGIHVRMDLVLDALPASVRPWLERAILLGVAFVGGFLAWAGWHYMVEAVGTTSAATAYPMPLLYASAVACGALVTVFGFERLCLAASDTSPEAATGSAV